MVNLNRKVLLVYNSKYGYVKEIIDAISKKLKEHDIESHIVDISKSKESNWPNISEYNGVIFGSNAGKFKFLPGKMLFFIKSNLDNLLTSKLPFAFFRSDPIYSEMLLDPDKARKDLEKSMLRHFGFNLPLYQVFGPVLDFSSRSKLDHDSRKRKRLDAKRISKKTGLEFDYKGYNDFRDWQQIEEFTQDFIKLIQSKFCPECGTKIDSTTQFCSNCGAKLNN
jgi:menaquinone-dependent protoporphyrinogen oxidase